MCVTKKQATNFVENGSKTDEIEGSASDYSFIGYSINKNGTIENIEKCGRALILRDTGAPLTLIPTKIWQQIGEVKLEEIASEIETYDHNKMQYLSVFFSKALYQNKFFHLLPLV